MFVSGGLFLAGVIVDCFLLVRVRLVKNGVLSMSPLISLITFLHVTHLERVNSKSVTMIRKSFPFSFRF